MRLDELGAEEFDGAKIVAFLGHDPRRGEASAGIFVDQKAAVGLRHGAEEAGRGVAHHVIFLGRDVEGEDIRHAGVIGRADQPLAVGGEGEGFRRGGRQVEPRNLLRSIAGHQRLGGPHADRLLAVDFAEAGRDQGAVG